MIAERIERIYRALLRQNDRGEHEAATGDTNYLLDLLREDKVQTSRLPRSYSTIESIRRKAETSPGRHDAIEASAEHDLSETHIRDLSHAAADGELEPIAGRSLETDGLIEILCSRNQRNPVLVGIHGSGRSAVVEGLAERIGAGRVPTLLAGKKVLQMEPELVARAARDPKRLERIAQFIRGCSRSRELILFVEDIYALWMTATRSESGLLMETLKQAVVEQGMQLIGACTAEEFAELREMTPWLRARLREVHIRPLDAEGTREVIYARKGRLESFHAVKFAGEALEFAARWAESQHGERSMQECAMDLLDAAATRVRLRGQMPETGLTARLAAIAEERALAGVARERGRGGVSVMANGPKRDRDGLAAVVTLEDVEETAARRGAYPFRA